MTIRDNTNRRLKEVLDIMAAASWLDKKPNGGEILAEAVKRVPFTPEEAELLTGGIPRGHKNLTKATASLAKVGWMTKGRSGWAITDNGLRATVAFDTVEKLVDALNNNTPVPADTPPPEKPAEQPAEQKAEEPAEQKAAKKAAAKKSTAKKASIQASVNSTDETAAVGVDGGASAEQPNSVSLAGDFNSLLGGSEDWDPTHDGTQMRLDESVWKLTLDLPAGHYSYKVVVNGSWDENYGAYGVPNGANHEFVHPGGPVTFHYSHVTKDVHRPDSY
ncbi:glycosidase [Specibacter sp. NPDC057265]|uniref:pullulanase X25 domain-containing protein n=1 Tax=Specibacter sp. NPDC057265 TaxID=3346075 RepID=UPI003637AA7C